MVFSHMDKYMDIYMQRLIVVGTIFIAKKGWYVCKDDISIKKKNKEITEIASRVNNAKTANVTLIEWICLGSERTFKGRMCSGGVETMTQLYNHSFGCTEFIIMVLVFSAEGYLTLESWDNEGVDRSQGCFWLEMASNCPKPCSYQSELYALNCFVSHHANLHLQGKFLA